MLLFYANISPVSCCVQQFQNFKVKNKGSDGVYLHSGSTHDQMITLLFIERDWARPYDQKVWFVNSLESIGIHGNDKKSKYFVCSKDFLSRKIFTFEIDFWTFSSHQKMLVFNWSTADESFSSSLARIFSFSKIKKKSDLSSPSSQTSQEIFGTVPG